MTFARISTVVAVAFLAGLLLALAWPIDPKVSVPSHPIYHETETVAQLGVPMALGRLH
jgi:hypothetical protein